MENSCKPKIQLMISPHHLATPSDNSHKRLCWVSGLWQYAMERCFTEKGSGLEGWLCVCCGGGGGGETGVLMLYGDLMGVCLWKSIRRGGILFIVLSALKWVVRVGCCLHGSYLFWSVERRWNR